MTDINIPPEALEAAVSAYRAAPPQMTHASAIRAAFLAMLKAWPGMGPIRTDQPIGDWCDKLPAIILPLPQEGE